MRATLQLIDSLLAVTVAPRCASCAGVLDEPRRGPVCSACWATVRALPGSAGDAATASISCCRAAGEYEGALRAIIHTFKYDDRRSLARPLGHLMRAAGCDLLDDAACVVPVPLHPWRHFRRGFNQAALLAAALERPVVRALWRTRWTRPQSGLGREMRERNVRRAFRMSPLLSRSRTHRFIAGRVVVLVDDVRTTGATLDACARVLLEAGAGEVRALTASVAR
jgi:ComF family protein